MSAKEFSNRFSQDKEPEQSKGSPIKSDCYSKEVEENVSGNQDNIQQDM